MLSVRPHLRLRLFLLWLLRLLRSTMEFEHNRQSVPYGNRFAILVAGGEIGHGLDHADGLGIKFFIYRADNLDFANVAIFLNDELQNDASLNIVLGSVRRILDVLHQILHHFCLAAWEPGHLFDRLIDYLFIVGLGRYRLLDGFLYRHGCRLCLYGFGQFLGS